MSEYAKTIGDYWRVLKHLPDNAPVEPFLNKVETKVFFEFSSDGTHINLIIEPNYTCPSREDSRNPFV